MSFRRFERDGMARGLPEARRLLVEAYDGAVLSQRTHREWFQKFNNSDFDVEDKDRSGRPKIYEDAKLEELLEEDSSQTIKELELTLEVTQQVVSHSLKLLGMNHKQGNWVPYELKLRDVERRLCMSEMLLARHKKIFLHRIVTGDEKWIDYDNPKTIKSWGLHGHAATSPAKPNIHRKNLMLCKWWDQLDLV
ncbi:Mariner Mos1 transposase [Eumeta japonica]|uniref:Mariner Mos1 transposase n=1 Tax=Eumeta variegata TaxID=151549 RepID=A0A4C1VZ72_EUMVA|nr:Mariner Mos1 transposase [Eumeta japonica]